jgi:hypothetical protein
LCSTLDEFSRDNWTSALSKKYDDDVTLDEESDFYYHDVNGTLTNQLFGERESDWQEYPEYFIEVKTTSGLADRPFYMSHKQVALVRLHHMTMFLPSS